MNTKKLPNKYVLVMHMLFWGGYLALSVFVFSGRENIDRALLISSVLMVPQIAIAYINMEWLIPRYFIKKEYLNYVLMVLLCFFGFYLFYEYVLPEIFNMMGTRPDQVRLMRGEGHGPGRPSPNPFRRMRIYYIFTQVIAIYFLSTAFKTSQIALKREKEAAVLKGENLNSELKFLRSQINPHFLFNALNNIYALAVIKSEKTPDNILKLSDMLRYIIYDCNAERVPLAKEINYILNYIDLQKLKDDRITNIEVDFNHADPDCMIAPMLFIPFIENSFKHSKIEDFNRGWIIMRIENQQHQLHFSIANSLDNSSYTKDKVGGVGLENVKRRLELIYPGRHQLHIESTEEKFAVELKIFLENEQ
ncbi:MAG: histidine kinase [Cyclobacteriaceae bacterium]|nr:histidine kinase [Cyclobacteriaceae bacterium]